MIIQLDDDREEGLLHDATCNCINCALRDVAEEAEELAALGDEPPPWWVPDSLDDEDDEDEGHDDEDDDEDEDEDQSDGSDLTEDEVSAMQACAFGASLSNERRNLLHRVNFQRPDLVTSSDLFRFEPVLTVKGRALLVTLGRLPAKPGDDARVSP